MATFICRLAAAPAAPGVLGVAVKDLIDLAGVVTTSGSRALAATEPPATADAACLAGTRAAEAAGRAVIVGKTNLHELAFGVTGVNPWFGTPANPLDPRLPPGGSSSGSAVAVATGEADVAFGTDTGGSIRIPAACCGVFGLKTTRGRISLAGVRPLAPSLDTVGPMAARLDLLESGMALLEPGFDSSERRPAVRVGRVRLPALAEVDRAIDMAIAAYCDRTGAESPDVELPGWDEATHAAMTVLSAEAWQTHAELWKDHAAELSPDVAERLELAALLDREEVAAAWEVARSWAGELRRRLTTVDVLALPVLSGPPPPLTDAGRLSEIRYAAPVNLAGVPALAMPVTWGPGDSGGAVPVSLQLVAAAGDEEALIATAGVMEAAAGWKGAPR